MSRRTPAADNAMTPMSRRTPARRRRFAILARRSVVVLPLQPRPTMLPNRWKHLARHGLLGTTLLGLLSPAMAEPCDDLDETTLGFTVGIQLSPSAKLIGGVEVRHCLADATEAMLRVELGGDAPRLIGGVRTRPFERGWEQEDGEDLGVEAGLVVDTQGRPGVHLAATLGTHAAYLAAQARVRVSGPEEATRWSLLGGLSPWAAFEPVVVEGRPLTVAGRILRPDILCRAPANAAESSAVAAHFTSSAQFEYSSGWTFLRLAHELAALGAPTRLIVAALDAADDEVRHAELCGQLAGGVQLATLPDDVARARFTTRSNQAIALLAAEAWLEGCLNEGAAAEEARIAATEADGPAKQALATIAIDERSHAELSWGVLAFLRDLAPEVVAQALAGIPRPPAPHGRTIDTALARHGVPTAEVTQDAWSSAERAATERLASLV